MRKIEYKSMCLLYIIDTHPRIIVLSKCHLALFLKHLLESLFRFRWTILNIILRSSSSSSRHRSLLLLYSQTLTSTMKNRPCYGAISQPYSQSATKMKRNSKNIRNHTNVSHAERTSCIKNFRRRRTKSSAKPTKTLCYRRMSEK